jgi:hypothetical protein
MRFIKLARIGLGGGRIVERNPRLFQAKVAISHRTEGVMLDIFEQKIVL